jgi:flagellar biogenesis protein FliO
VKAVVLHSGTNQLEIHMYIGGGLLGTVLLILLIVWLVRRV